MAALERAIPAQIYIGPVACTQIYILLVPHQLLVLQIYIAPLALLLHVTYCTVLLQHKLHAAHSNTGPIIYIACAAVPVRIDIEPPHFAHLALMQTYVGCSELHLTHCTVLGDHCTAGAVNQLCI